MKPDVHPREKRLAAKQKVDAELTRARTALVKLRTERDAITVGLRKGELIPKQDALMGLGFLLTALRQKILSFPHTLQRRLANKEAHEIGRILEEAVHSLLQDLSEWPMRVVDPNWVEHIDEDLRPPPKDAGNGNGDAEGTCTAGTCQCTRRERRAKAKEG